MYKVFAKSFYFLISIPANILNFLKYFFGLLASKLVFLRGGNIFFKSFVTDTILISKISYGGVSLKVILNNFWDFWRTKNFETYPIKNLLNNLNELKKSKDKVVFYEIGANTGYCSLLVAEHLKNLGKIYSFEVEPTNFKTLCDNVILNKCKNIVPLNIGISDENILSKFYYNMNFAKKKNFLPQSAMGMHSINFDKNVHDEGVFCSSPFMKYDKIIEIFNLEIPTHVYIDAYGAEEKIIKSILNSKKEYLPTVIFVDVEENIESVKNSRIYKLLIDKGYFLEEYNKEIGFKNLPNYQSVFKLKKK